jgi:hypothetical protein
VPLPRRATIPGRSGTRRRPTSRTLFAAEMYRATRDEATVRPSTRTFSRCRARTPVARSLWLVSRKSTRSRSTATAFPSGHAAISAMPPTAVGRRSSTGRASADADGRTCLGRRASGRRSSATVARGMSVPGLGLIKIAEERQRDLGEAQGVAACGVADDGDVFHEPLHVDHTLVLRLATSTTLAPQFGWHEQPTESKVGPWGPFSERR